MFFIGGWVLSVSGALGAPNCTPSPASEVLACVLMVAALVGTFWRKP
jgi:hypothetical protein